jgi:tetratricopeptide (TPR) repeat protein
LVSAYSNGLSGPFVYDDELTIRDNRSIRELRLPDVFSAEQDSPTAGRPLVNGSFAINYALNGLDVRAYHATNLFIHIVCALLLFGLVRRTLDLQALRDRFRDRSTSIALATALVWALHPLNSEVVEYLTQRSESLMALFYLLTIYASVRAIGAERPERWQALAVLVCALGMACKESMVTAPIMVVLYDRAYQFDSLTRAFARRGRFYGALAAIWVVLAVLMWPAPRGESAGFASGASPWTYLLNQSVIVTDYLRHAFWPKNLVANYGWIVPLTLIDVAPFAILIALLLVIAAATWLLRPKIGFLGVWFFLTLAPTSSVVPIPIEVGAERRMYLPLMALAALVVIAGATLLTALDRKWIGERRFLSRYGGAALVAVISLALATATLIRNREYASPLSLYRTAVARWPNYLGYHILGSALLTAGADQEAERVLRVALDGAPRAHYDLGVSLFNQKRLDEAAEHFATLIRIWESPPASHSYWQPPVRGDVAGAHLLMGRAFAQQERWARAAEQFEHVIRMSPSDVEARHLLAGALFSDRSFEQAIAHYNVYLQSRPRDVGALTNLGIALVSVGKDEDAIAVFRRAVDIDPANGSSQRNLANALFDHGDLAEAATHAAEAVKLRPDDPEANNLLTRTSRIP